MKNKFSKSIAFAIVVAMLMAMVPAVVMAEAPVISDATVAIDNVEGEKVVTVTATVTGDLSEFTLLAVRDNKAYTSISDIPSDVAAAGETMSALEKQVEYIDQPDLEGATISYQFPLRDREGDLAMTLADSYINVFLGGAGAEAVVAYEVEKLDAPAIAVEDLQEKYYTEDESLVITYTGSDEAVNLWEGKELEVKIGDEVLTDAAWVKEADHFKVPASDFAAAAYENATITIAETADPAAFYPATVTGVTFATASRVEEATAAVVTTVEQVPNGDDTAVTITIPADKEVAGVAIAYEIVSTEGFTDNGDRTITVTRPAEDAAPVVIEFVATLTYGDLVIAPVTFNTTVRPAGAAIEPEMVTILKASGAYGDASKALVKVVVGADVVDPAGQNITGLYYSPQKEAFYGVVDKAIATDAETVAEALSDLIAEGEAETFYFGVTAAGRTAPDMRDFGYAGRLTKKAENPTPKQYIALDVNDAEPNGLYDMRDFGAHGRKTKRQEFPVLAQ